MTMLKHLKEITGDETLTVHGFRTTFRTWAQEETDFEEEIVEHCLHHITGDDAEKVYKRGEALRKRRIVMQAFANGGSFAPIAAEGRRHQELSYLIWVDSQPIQ